MKQGRVDLAINRFNEIPQSFHQVLVWRDTFSCLLSADSPYVERFNLKNYLKAQHVWVSKAGMGVGFGVNPEKSGGLGAIDQALQRLGQKRQIMCQLITSGILIKRFTVHVPIITHRTVLNANRPHNKKHTPPPTQAIRPRRWS